ncbi:hypothetical protein B0I27_102286 [Arcticibacter pallidicorallinus]|uniref:Uncharacterized protein n=1 Tax=Arcticibacter pallidicorallinus TaxID=1259464 RepID=A0A2T0U9C3_9SPHI|nr:hypothetical protein [Arcticibacter pallidicorallinus]PRY54519.1 hypothetical protein B0I27_102286 [Arcticibacter pallidicorallinus]
MDEPFLIPVSYLGKDLEYEGRLHIMGYLHKIEINIDGIPVIFEPDEERNYRALVSHEQINKSKQLSAGLLQAIAMRLNSLLGH